MNPEAISNIAVKANIWCDKEQKNGKAVPYFLEDIIPGDLLVEFIGTRDSRIIAERLTSTQRHEYEQSRFFQNHGQEGLAFEG
jgi:hypothetical protein